MGLRGAPMVQSILPMDTPATILTALFDLTSVCELDTGF